MEETLTMELSSKGYWPAMAGEYFRQKKYSRAVELCTMRLEEQPEILSGRIILARSLFHSGQMEASEEQFYRVLQCDPENLAALKYLGDIRYCHGDEVMALSYYDKVLNINPYFGGLFSAVEEGLRGETKVLTLRRESESPAADSAAAREIPFKTETAADLLLSQGHTRLAMEIYRDLAARFGDGKYVEKLNRLRALNKKKEKDECPS